MDYLLIDPYQSTHHSLTPGWARLVWCTALCQWYRESYISSVTLVRLEAVSCGQIPSKETCPWSYGYQCPWVCTSHLGAIAVFACPGRTLGSPLLLWIFMEPCPKCSSALIIHFCGHRQGQQRLQLRGSVLRIHKDLPSVSRQVFLAVLEVHSEQITVDGQCNMCAFCWENRRSPRLSPFCGSNLCARKEITTGIYEALLPKRLCIFSLLWSPKDWINCIQITSSHFKNSEVNEELRGW